MKKKTLTGYIVDGVIYDLDTSLLICKSEEIMNDTALYYSKNKNFFIVERDKIYGSGHLATRVLWFKYSNCIDY